MGGGAVAARAVESYSRRALRENPPLPSLLSLCAGQEKAATRSPETLRVLVAELKTTIEAARQEMGPRSYSAGLETLLSRTLRMLSAYAEKQASRLAGRASLVCCAEG